MSTKKINQDKVYAKLLALSIIYEKDKSCQQSFLQRISYSNNEITIVMESVCDSVFRNWIKSSIPLMQCINS